MEKTFVFGVSVEGDNFTDRTLEAKRIRSNFENGVNTILISPRRIGKTSLVKKVWSSITVPSIKTIYMDIYDCRNEYDFYTRFATSVLQGSSSRIEHALESAKEFSISLGIKPKDIEPETILSLPEKIARAGNYIVPSGKNSPEKASAHRHLHRRIPTDRRIPRFAHRPETPARLMAAPAVHLILPLRKQKAYDGKHISEQTYAVLHVRRHILPETHSDR